MITEKLARLYASIHKFIPLLLVVFFACAIVVTVRVMQQRQEVRSKAAADTAVLSFSPTTVSGDVSQQFPVAILLNTGSQAVVAADFVIQFDQNRLTLMNVSRPGAQHVSFRTYVPLLQDGTFDTQTILTDANQNGTIRFGVVAVDYVGQQVMQAFTGVVSPIATLEFQPKTGGSSTIRFAYDGASSTTDSNVIADLSLTGGQPEDILAQPTSVVQVSISGGTNPTGGTTPTRTPTPSRTPTPAATLTPTPASCPTAPFNTCFDCCLGRGNTVPSCLSQCPQVPTPTGIIVASPTATRTPTPIRTSTPIPSATPTGAIGPTATRTPTPGTTGAVSPTPKDNEPTPTPIPPAGESSIIPNPPSWWSLVPRNLRDFIEMLYLLVFVYGRPSNMMHLLEGIVPPAATPTPVP